MRDEEAAMTGVRGHSLGRVEDDRLGFGTAHCLFEQIPIDGPLVCGDDLARAAGWRDEWHVSGHTSVEGALTNVLVKEGLEENDLIVFLEESEQGRVNAAVCACCDLDIGFGVESQSEVGAELGKGGVLLLLFDGSLGGGAVGGLVRFGSGLAELGAVKVGDGVAETRATLWVRVVVGVDAVGDGLCGGVLDEVWGRPVHEPLTEVDGRGEYDGVEQAPYVCAPSVLCGDPGGEAVEEAGGLCGCHCE